MIAHERISSSPKWTPLDVSGFAEDYRVTTLPDITITAGLNAFPSKNANPLAPHRITRLAIEGKRAIHAADLRWIFSQYQARSSPQHPILSACDPA